MDLSTQVPVEERRAPGSVTYVLKGAQVTHYNNTNALVTVHFNTPVYRARLVPSGNDLLFVVDLRDPKAAPAMKISPKGQGAILTVDFGKGDYVAPQPQDGEHEVRHGGPSCRGYKRQVPWRAHQPWPERQRDMMRYAGPRSWRKGHLLEGIRHVLDGRTFRKQHQARTRAAAETTSS